jgi:hypothetical protein
MSSRISYSRVSHDERFGSLPTRATVWGCLSTAGLSGFKDINSGMSFCMFKTRSQASHLHNSKDCSRY